jgi:hypothetical protein
MPDDLTQSSSGIVLAHIILARIVVVKLEKSIGPEHQSGSIVETSNSWFYHAEQAFTINEME